MRLALCLALLGCNGDALSLCATRLTVHFPTFALDADQVQIGTQLLPHTAGQASQSYPVSLDGDVTVSALRAGAVVTSTTATAASCATADVNLAFSRDSIRVPQTLKNRVDLLFMIDDSNSMVPKQQQLRTEFPILIQQLDEFAAKGAPAWYHIGVVTSDLGTPNGEGGCSMTGGLGGKLQALGRAHNAACQPPTGGLHFIDYNQLAGTNNLPPGQDLQTTFSCMAAVGEGGCGFESQLEAVYQALSGCLPGDDDSYSGCTIIENQGFLRNDSLLVVVLLTDEDDCSAPPDSDVFQRDPDGSSTDSFTCVLYGVICGGQLVPDVDSGGPLAECQGAPNPDGAGPGKLFDPARYIDFFQRQVRSDPDDVILISLAAPPTPFHAELVTSSGELCPPENSRGCSVEIDHSCSSSKSFFGDPAVRISQVVRSSPNHQETSICDPDYSPALSGLAGSIARTLGVACLPGAVANPVSPDCTVRDVSPGGSVTLPACGQPPCWRAVTDESCAAWCADGVAPQQLAVRIDRGGQQPPAGTVAEIDCSIYNRDLTQPLQTCP